MKKLRKFLTIGVMVLSIIAMSGLTVNTAKAAAQAGDLIKMDGLSSVYYLGNDGKRYVFPSEAVYFSWYSDFSGVVTIPASELQTYPLGSNVTMRPGTKLVKITTDPSVYAVTPNGVLRKIQSEADALTLFGTNWNKMIVDVADSFFTNYTVGSPMPSGTYPAGTLLKNADNASIYYFDGTNYRLIASEAAFTANRFSFNNVVTTTMTLTASGTSITGAETFSQPSASTTTGPISSGSGVSVALSSSTPVSQSVPSTVSRVPFTKVNFTASNDGHVVLESIIVKRSGLSDSADFDRVWVEMNGSAVTSKRALNTNNEAVLTFAPALTINAGQTITLDIIASLNDISGNAALEIASASAITAGGASVTGSFPVRGNLMAFADYDVTTLNFDVTTAGDYDVKVGDTDVELGVFDIEFGTDPRDVIVSSVTLRNSGVEDMSASILGLRLENNGEVVSNTATFDGRNVTFTMKNGGLTMLKDDGDQTFYVKGDVIAKESISPDSLNLSLQRKEDLNAYEKATGFGVSYATATYPVAVSEVTITSGAVSVAKKSASPANTSVVPGSKNVVVLLANAKADEAINAEGLKLYYANVEGGSESSFNNVRLYVNNVLLGSFDAATTTDITTFDTEMIDSSLSLKKGDNEIKVTVDVKSTTNPGDQFTAKLMSSSGNTFDLPEYVNNGNSVHVDEISGTAEGAEITVEGGAYEVSRNDGFAIDRPIIQGTTDVVLGRFAVKALNDAVRINSVVLGPNTGASATTTSSSIYDMKLFVDGVQIGTTRNFSNGATFSSVNYTIAQNTTKIIELRGSFDSSAVDDSRFLTVLTFNAQDSLGKVITPAKTAATQQFQVKESGTLTIAKGPNTPNSDIIVAAAGTEKEVAQFRLTSQNDASVVTEIAIENVNSDVASDRVSEYRLYLGNTLLDTTVPMTASSTIVSSLDELRDVARFYIANNALTVGLDQNVTISVRAVLNTIDAVAQSNKTVQIAVSEVVAKSSNGATLTVGVTNNGIQANAMVIRKTKPTMTLLNGITGGAASTQELIRFTVTADANEDVSLNNLVFTKNGSSALASTTAFSLFEVGNSTAIQTNATTPSFIAFAVTVGKGESKTFRVVGNTTAVDNDKTFGISLNDEAASMVWDEYYVGGFAGDYSAQYIKTLPLDGGVLKY